MEFEHIPILLEESIEALKIKEAGTYVDGTIGGAGHSQEILKRLKGGRLIGIDQDPAALKKAKSVLEPLGKNFSLVHGNYKDMPQILEDLSIDRVDGVLLDIGVSSHQFDEAERGFSYRFDAPLDMRMDPQGKVRAYDLVNDLSGQELEDIIFKFGEERWAKRISDFIVKERQIRPLETTYDLVEVIKKAIPKSARRKGGHPAKQTFQALRIAVNNELGVLEESIPQIVDLLNPGGRLAIISFHSLEDRIVKKTFQYLNQSCVCPPELPVCVCNKKREIKIISKKPLAPSKEEMSRNPRSKSAKLRVAEKL
ncbi:MAG: 16S rRNA (cytosine(1402)-N(4))-methyltransferase RsmH [Tissierellia bacterium]|nr:16S rRNA (cytosine(1402)-N(4))-methyltransferase RsmH [Tissierellia bacterium]